MAVLDFNGVGGQSQREKVSITEVESRALQELRHVAGFDINSIEIDTEDFVRCPIERQHNRSKKPGAYKIWSNNYEMPYLLWYDHTQGLEEHGVKLFDEAKQIRSDRDRGDFEAYLKKAKQEAAERRSQAYEKAASDAEEYLSHFNAVPKNNIYLLNKHVDPVDGLLGNEFELIYPLKIIDGKITSFQKIYYDRYGECRKYLMKGGKKAGSFFEIKGEGDVTYFAEGIATAVSIYMATGATTVCCIDCGNFKHVIKAFRKKYPSAKFVIVGDYDFASTDSKGNLHNSGFIEAIKNAKKYNCLVAIPYYGKQEYDECGDFDENGQPKATPMTDANDFHCCYGLDKLKEILEHPFKPEEFKESEGIKETKYLPTSAISKMITSSGEEIEVSKEWQEDDRPVIQYDPDMVIQCRNDLAKRLHPYVYMFGVALVRVIMLKEKKILRKDRYGNAVALLPKGTTSIDVLDAKAVSIEAAKVARWEKWDERSKGYKSCTPPTDVSDHIFHDRFSLNFRILNGIVNCPIIFPDGRILEQEGYDEESGLLLDFCGVQHYHYQGLTFNKELAEFKLQTLFEALKEFPFKSDVDKSVAVALIMTAVIRKVLKKAPMFVFSANMPGTGKTALCKLAGIVATGKIPAALRWISDITEMEKSLFATILEGAQVVLIDNANNIRINNNTLAQAATDEIMKGRILGVTKHGEAPSNALWMINGNHISVVEDMRRRVLLCELSTKEEHPERRKFENRYFFEWLELNRRELIAAVIDILKCYIEAGKPDMNISPLADFQEWSDFVRAPIVWLGLPDPLQVQEKMAVEDPIRNQLGAVLTAWNDLYGDKLKTVKQLFEERSTTPKDKIDLNPQQYTDNILFQALDGIQPRGDLTSKIVAGYINKHLDEPVNGLQIKKPNKKPNRLNQWEYQVVKVD